MMDNAKSRRTVGIWENMMVLVEMNSEQLRPLEVVEMEWMRDEEEVRKSCCGQRWKKMFCFREHG